jgi:hypothetical protein
VIWACALLGILFAPAVVRRRWNLTPAQSRAVRSRVRLNVAISIDLFGDWWLLLIAVVLQLSEPLWRSG